MLDSNGWPIQLNFFKCTLGIPNDENFMVKNYEFTSAL